MDKDQANQEPHGANRGEQAFGSAGSSPVHPATNDLDLLEKKQRHHDGTKRNIALQRAYQRQWMRDRRAEGLAAMGGKCVRCGSKDRLEVDHIDPTSKVTHRVWAMGRAKREAELAKCQLLCRSCHQKKSAPEIGAAVSASNRRRADDRKKSQAERDAAYNAWLATYRNKPKRVRR